MYVTMILAAVLIGMVSGLVAGTVAVRCGHRGGPVAITGGFTFAMAYLVSAFGHSLVNPMRRYVSMLGLALLMAGLGAFMVGAMAGHFEKLRETWEKEDRREFRLKDLVKGDGRWLQLVALPLVLLIAAIDRPSRLPGIAFICGFVFLSNLLLICMDLVLIRLWRRFESPAPRDDA